MDPFDDGGWVPFGSIAGLWGCPCGARVVAASVAKSAGGVAHSGVEGVPLGVVGGE